jgi:hypothetical protein
MANDDIGSGETVVAVPEVFEISTDGYWVPIFSSPHKCESYGVEYTIDKLMLNMDDCSRVKITYEVTGVPEGMDKDEALDAISIGLNSLVNNIHVPFNYFSTLH